MITKINRLTIYNIFVAIENVAEGIKRIVATLQKALNFAGGTQRTTPVLKTRKCVVPKCWNIEIFNQKGEERIVTWLCYNHAIRIETLITTGRLKNWVLPNWPFGDPASSWKEILMIFVTNLEMSNSVKHSFLRHPVCIMRGNKMRGRKRVLILKTGFTSSKQPLDVLNVTLS